MNVDDLPVPELAAPETERESAIETILSDTKTAMTGLPALRECAEEPSPAVGDRFCVADSAGRPVAQALPRGGTPACCGWSSRTTADRAELTLELVSVVVNARRTRV
jgi:hypothetical protein